MKYIWTDERQSSSYAEFTATFNYSGKKAELAVASDRSFFALINGEIALNGQYPDAGEQSSFTVKDISGLLKKGENTLFITAYHVDRGFAQSRVKSAGMAFEIVEDGKVIALSDKNTLCRVSPKYSVSGFVTPQIGYGYEYDFGGESEWHNAVEIKDAERVARRAKSCELLPPVQPIVAAQGIFKYRGGETVAEKYQNAWLSTLRFADMTGKDRVQFDRKFPLSFKGEGGDGIFVIIDLAAENAGYLHLNAEFNKACSGAVCWGEHLSDLRVRSSVGGRGFAYAMRFKKGENVLDEFLHRMGCRYICLFAETDELKLNGLTLIPMEYPFKKIEKKIEDRLLKKIYEVGERTLRLCAHEHYEDCPWREQALYGMDSRNQTLFGYSVFEEYELPRASLRLCADSARKDGLIELCPPSDEAPITIPSFSAYWMIAVKENADFDYDGQFVLDMLPAAEKMLECFESRTGENGVEAFIETPYWNFHEWSDGLDGGMIFRSEEIAPYTDGLLTALVIVAARGIAELEKREGFYKKAERIEAYTDRLCGCLEGFYDENIGLYYSFIENGERKGLHGYTQAAFIFTGEVCESRARKMCEELKYPTVTVPVTFASLQLKYHAILETDGDGDYCIEDVCRIYGKMLFGGATSYWETENGEADFNDAGSLCHAWASVPCWLMDKLGIAKKV